MVLMKILLISVGTRGDMEPFVAIGEVLRKAGHEVQVAFPEQFRALAVSSSLTFNSLGSKLMDLLDSPAGKAAMGGASGWKKFLGTLKLAFNQKQANMEIILKQKEIVDKVIPDRILYSGKALYPIIWELDHEGRTCFISPIPDMHYSEGHSHIAFHGDYGRVINKLSFKLARFGIKVSIKSSLKWLGMKNKYEAKSIERILKFNKSIYTISPSLFPRPKEWPDSLQVLGYRASEIQSDWKAPDALDEFCKKHPKLLFISFGSMGNSNPLSKTNLILNTLSKQGIPAVINTAAGGLTKPKNYASELVYFVSEIPYSWILPRAYAVIHHGGSGTTHLGLKHGCATMIIPHIIDQFAWNKLIYQRGAGPLGSKISKLKAGSFYEKLHDLWNNSEYKRKAEQLSISMQSEEFNEELVDMIIQ